MNVEQLLEDALQARTADVRPDPTARDRIAEQLGGAARGASHPRRRAAVFATAAAVITVAGVAVGAAAWSRHGDGTPAPGGTGTSRIGYLPGYPLPPSRYFVGLRGLGAVVTDVVVRVSDGKVVATLPDIGSQAPDEPQLSPDGTRAYAVWGNGTRLGWIDLKTGDHKVLVHRKGEVASPTLSADGTTLAYQWTPKLDGNDVSSIVIRTLKTGKERVLPHAPAGPQELPLALSPDGSQLALVPTDRSGRPLWIVRTDRADAFAKPTVIAGADCGSGRADQPRWTAHGLYAVRRCLKADGTVDAANFVTIDPTRHRVVHTRVLVFVTGQFPVSMIVLAGPDEPKFVLHKDAADTRNEVEIVKGGSHPRFLAVHGVSGLPVSGAE